MILGAYGQTSVFRHDLADTRMEKLTVAQMPENIKM